MTTDKNLLGQESSPYLLQHADNPVHWRPWGKAALATARETGKPILLSVGYAACHWCHVMAHESFEDADTAALMNRLYVCIKVDREERPDIDHLYMSALHALGEQGGWPLTMFLTPDGTPFWGGTYFPPEPRYGRPSFKQVLEGVVRAWHDDKEAIHSNTKALLKSLAGLSRSRPGQGIGPAQLDEAASRLQGAVDPIQGGLRGAPKFPNPPIFRFLLQNDFRTASESGRKALHHLLRVMSQGGIYDHLGGGYARYATDSAWLVPHFEKMLYDNAQLLDLLALAQADQPNPLYAERAEETVAWLLRDMIIPEGAGFAASEDADSEGEEGRFYVWTEAEIDTLLGPASPPFKQAYDVTPSGNWEGHTILHRVTERGDDTAEAALAQARAILFAARETRIRPGRDDKLLADWNGLAIAALARAAGVFAHPPWLTQAEAAFAAVLTHLGREDGRVDHAWRLGRITAAGLLEDQAMMARAALALYEATGKADYLHRATTLANAALRFFGDKDGGFYSTANDAADVPLGAEARPRLVSDNATPSGNGVMAEVLARLYHLTGASAWRQHTETLLKSFAGYGAALSTMPSLLVAAHMLEAATTVVVVGDLAAPQAEALAAVALASPDPATIVLRVAATSDLAPEHPGYGKQAGETGASAYLCRHGVCQAPVTTPEALRKVMEQQ